MVVSGSQQAISLSPSADRRRDRVLFEDPGYFAARACSRLRGGDRARAGRRGRLRRRRAVHMAPPRASLHHAVAPEPLCVTMSLPRRRALLPMGRANGSWILEDDNASECRYRGRPLAALQGIDQTAASSTRARSAR